MQNPPDTRDAWLYATLLAGSAGFILWLAPMAIEVPETIAHPGLSPRFLPNILAGCVGALSLLGLLRALAGPRSADATADHAEALLEARERRTLLAFALLCASYPLSLAVGMAAAAGVLAAALLALGRERRPLSYATVAVVLPALVFLFFVHVLNVPVPDGALLRWLS